MSKYQENELEAFPSAASMDSNLPTIMIEATPMSTSEAPTQPSLTLIVPKSSDAQIGHLSVPLANYRKSFESDVTLSSSTLGSPTYIPATPDSPSPIERCWDGASAQRLIRRSSTQEDCRPFGISPRQLYKLSNPKSLVALDEIGSLRGLEMLLRTDLDAGLSCDETSLHDSNTPCDEKGTTAKQEASSSTSRDRPVGMLQERINFVDRQRIFGDNTMPERTAKSFLRLLWDTYNDKVLILLTIAAVISLALGIYQSISAQHGQPRVQWVEGVAITVAIVVVTLVGAINDWHKELQFAKLNKKKEQRMVKVIRSGRTAEISIYDVLVGDVINIEPGDVIPADGVLIQGHSIKCDESSATGESKLLSKTPASKFHNLIPVPKGQVDQDPFIISGTKVVDGVGTFLVTATGTNSIYGRTMMSLQIEDQTTPLQQKLSILAGQIAKLGLAAGLILFLALFIRFLVELKDMGDREAKGQAFLRIFIVAVTIVVVAVPEGLPLAVTMALAFATTRMFKDNNLVRYLKACEVMGNATTICSDKTGTLTANKMSVVAATFGADEAAYMDIDFTTHADSNEQPNKFAVNAAVRRLSAADKEMITESIALNTTAFEGSDNFNSDFIGSKTEAALLMLARDHLGMGPVSEERSKAPIVHMIPFQSDRKWMSVTVKRGTRYRMYVKGASEIVLAASTQIHSTGMNDKQITVDRRANLDNFVTDHASRSLRTIGLAYRDFDVFPYDDTAMDQQATVDAIFKRLTLFGIVGIRDPLRPGVGAAVRQCQEAGVSVRMVTGDNLLTAKAIGAECGIMMPNGITMEGSEFRQLSPLQMSEIVPRLHILARASPEDKKNLVTQLKSLGEIVAVTGDGTNDAPALKTADVGFSMGIAGTEVAKEASDIVLLDDNFTSLVRAIAWGRTVNDAVKKFLQFQITVNITAVLLTLISSVASGQETGVLTAVQLLWVNLIMDTFAALALATDLPSPHILQRKPETRTAPLISLTMWKMIIGQAIYQLVVTLVLNFVGKRTGFYSDNPNQAAHLETLVFNTFVWMQIFNQFNCRRVDNHLNIFEDVHRNQWFMGIQAIIVAGQIMIIFIGGQAFSVQRLSAVEWAISLALSAPTLPLGVLIRKVPMEAVLERVQSSGRFSFRGGRAKDSTTAVSSSPV